MNKFIVVIIFPLIALCGCAGKSIPTHFYTLKADRGVETSTATLPTTVGLGIGPLELPEILDRIGIVSSKKHNELTISSYNVWAGDLRDSMLRVLADNVSSQLGHDRVWTFPWDNRNRPEYQLRIVIEEFSGTLGDQVLLRAKWSLLGAKGRKEVLTKRSSYQETVTGNGYDDYVKALNTALNDFSQELSRQVTATLRQEPDTRSSAIEQQ